MGKPLPPAPILCDDVLYCLFEEIDCKDSPVRDWAAASLVCRGWYRAAQAALYQTFRFYAGGVSNKRCERFAQTMLTCPHLRPLLRHLTLWQYQIPDEEQLSWIHLLPENTLQSFQYLWRLHTPLLKIFDAPAVRTVTHLSITGVMTPEIVQTCAEFPRLESLQMLFYEPDDWELTITPSPTLKHLSIAIMAPSHPRSRSHSHSHSNPNSHSHPHSLAAYRLLASCAPQLSTLTLLAPFDQMHTAHGPALASALASRPTQLVRLSLFGPACAWAPPQPFADELVLHNRALEYVCCPIGAYSEAFFERIEPASVRVLELAVGGYPYPYERALVEFVGRAAGRGCPGALQRVCMRTGDGDAKPWAHVAGVCRKSGVEFCVEGYDEDGYSLGGIA